MKSRIAFLTIILLALAATPAVAQYDLYDNGPINGTLNAWTINFGFVVSDSFTAMGEVSGVSFGAWLFPGDVLQSAEVSITSAEFGGTTYFDGTVRFAQSACVGNQYGFNVCTETGSFNAFLNAGTYWLNLQNAVVNTGDPVYWDENFGGPASHAWPQSLASENSVGTIPSESFSILGMCGAGAGCASAGAASGTPEPSTLLLLGSVSVALLGVGKMRRFFGGGA